MIQGSPEWKAERCGKVTASRVGDATARTKTGWGSSRDNYMAELIVERLTGQPVEQYTNAAMAWGTQTEPEARSAYAFHAGVNVEEVGFVAHPTVQMSGGSPDGFVGTDGLVEFKCPQTATHIATLLGAEIDLKYIKQMQWCLACTERNWCDFVSYDPRLPLAMQLHIRRVHRDEKMIAQLEKEVTEFLTELAAKVDILNARYLKAAA